MVASNAGDLTGDSIEDLFAGGPEALVINGKNGERIGSRSLPSSAMAMATMGDLTGDTASEMVIGGANYLYCLTGHLKKWGTGIDPPGKKESIPGNLTITPNPASGKVEIGFYLDRPSRISVAVFNLTSEQTVAFPGVMADRGFRTFMFDVSGLSPGISIVIVETGARILTGKMVVIH